jgi:cytochrome c oxidase assembly factor CtaG
VNNGHTGQMASTRTGREPRIAVAAWLVAGLVLVVLAIVVIRDLARSGSTVAGGTDPMGMQVSTALYRAGSSGTQLHPLLGWRLLTAWQLDSVAVAVLVVLSAAYLTAASLVPLRTGGATWPRGRTAFFLVGMGVCAFATNGSVAVYDEVLFSAHMLGHLALVMVAPAFIVAGRPLRLVLSASSAATRDRIERVVQGRVASLLTAPPVALACYAVVIVGTHLTGLMNTIMRVSWAGQLEHLVFLLVGCQFFSLVIGDEPIRWRLAAPARWLLLAVAMAVDTFTGVVLMQETSPVSMLATHGFPVDALADTHTGGAIMWFGGDAIMAAVMLFLVLGWLHRPEQRVRDQQGWAEQARRATFEAHTGAIAGGSDGTSANDLDDNSSDDFDDSDAARAAYNKWLSNLASER